MLFVFLRKVTRVLPSISPAPLWFFCIHNKCSEASEAGPGFCKEGAVKNLQGSAKELPLVSPIECATFLGKRFSSSQRLMVYLSVRSCAGCRPKNSAATGGLSIPVSGFHRDGFKDTSVPASAARNTVRTRAVRLRDRGMF
jgi:hypothetical protein